MPCYDDRMRAEELVSLLHRRPFRPMRLHITSGEHVDIRHPEMALVSRSLVAVGLAGRGMVADHFVWYNLIHVVKISPLNGNGHRRKRSQGRRGTPA